MPFSLRDLARVQSRGQSTSVSAHWGCASCAGGRLPWGHQRRGLPRATRRRRGGRESDDQVRNLYSITTNQSAIIALFRAINYNVGNLPPMPGVFPDYPAPVVRNAGSAR